MQLKPCSSSGRSRSNSSALRATGVARLNVMAVRVAEVLLQRWGHQLQDGGELNLGGLSRQQLQHLALPELRYVLMAMLAIASYCSGQVAGRASIPAAPPAAAADGAP
jgi:hypothetical protein